MTQAQHSNSDDRLPLSVLHRRSWGVHSSERAVVTIDCDEVLLDTSLALCELLRRSVAPLVCAAAARQIEALTPARLRRAQARGSLTAFAREQLCLSGDELERVFSLIARDGAAAYLEHARPYPGAHALIETVHACGYLAVIASNNFPSVIGPALARFELAHDGLVGRTMITAPKPAPDSLRLAAQLGNGHVAYHLGDSRDDQLAAAATESLQDERLCFVQVARRGAQPLPGAELVVPSLFAAAAALEQLELQSRACAA